MQSQILVFEKLFYVFAKEVVQVSKIWINLNKVKEYFSRKRTKTKMVI